MTAAIQTIVPESEDHWLTLRAQDITSTEVSALFGISPYTTLFEVWHRHMENIVVKFEANERTRWGLRLQDSIAAGVAEDQGWKVRRMDEYIRIPSLKAGSSFDFAVNTTGLLEIKNVDALMFRDGWMVDGDNIEAPPHIEMQVQHQLRVSGRKEAHIGALVGGNRLVLIKREPDEKVIAAMDKKIEWFWNTIADKKEPKPDFSRDADVIRQLYSQAEEGKVFDARGNAEINDLVSHYSDVMLAEKTVKAQKDEIKSRLIATIGDCEKAVGDNFTISAGLISETVIDSYTRAGYRNFIINVKKGKPS